MSKRFALLVGMTAYQDDRLAVTATSMAVRNLADQLRDPENGRFDRVESLLNQTAVALQLGIASFFEQEMAADDLVLFYFAGHSLIHHQNIYLAAADTFTEEYLDATTVEVDFVRRRLNTCPARQVVLLDCDFSLIGATDRHTDGFEMLAHAFQSEMRAVLVAPQLTGPLATGLQGEADADQDGIVTFAELAVYAQAQLPETDPPSLASHDITYDAVTRLPLAFCAAKAAVPLTPFPVSASSATSSKKRRYGLGVLAGLLLLAFLGYFVVNGGLFSGGDEVLASTTTAVAAIMPEASKTPTTQAGETAVSSKTPAATKSANTPTATNAATKVLPTPASTPQPTATVEPTVTKAATNTATPTATDSPTATNSPTATSVPTDTATPTATSSPTATNSPTATHSPTPAATSVPVPMTVAAQQAFLRAGPDTTYRILDYPKRGTAVTVIARNSEATWYNVILEDGSRGWLYVTVLAAADEDDFDGISIAATIPAPLDDFFDPVLTRADGRLRLQVNHTYVGTQGNNARFLARLLPETDLVQPTYLTGQELGFGLLKVEFNRVGEGEYMSRQMELCMVAESGAPFYCETIPARKSW